MGDVDRGFAITVKVHSRAVPVHRRIIIISGDTFIELDQIMILLLLVAGCKDKNKSCCGKYLNNAFHFN